MNVLYLVTRGASDPTGATVPLHLAVNGSLQVDDQEVGVVLAGDGTDLARAATRQVLHGVAVPPAVELFDGLADHEVPVYV